MLFHEINVIESVGIGIRCFNDVLQFLPKDQWTQVMHRDGRWSWMKTAERRKHRSKRAILSYMNRILQGLFPFLHHAVLSGAIRRRRHCRIVFSIKIKSGFISEILFDQRQNLHRRDTGIRCFIVLWNEEWSSSFKHRLLPTLTLMRMLRLAIVLSPQWTQTVCRSESSGDHPFMISSSYKNCVHAEHRLQLLISIILTGRPELSSDEPIGMATLEGSRRKALISSWTWLMSELVKWLVFNDKLWALCWETSDEWLPRSLLLLLSRVKLGAFVREGFFTA